jgi:FHS family L-fucose permease-like MFS transporter
MLNLCLFFESVCFPTIVALGIRGLGRHTKRGAGWIIGSVIGGACSRQFLPPTQLDRCELTFIVPPLLAKVADIYNSTAIGMIVPTCVFLGGLTYAAAVNFVPSYRIQADSVDTIHTPPEPIGKSGLEEAGRDIKV